MVDSMRIWMPLCTADAMFDWIRSDVEHVKVNRTFTNQVARRMHH